MKEYIHSIGKNDQWTEFQGKIYGIGIDYAEPYQGAIETMENLKIKGHELFIVSHKSKRPYLGEKYDLHAAAKRWIMKWLYPNNLFAGKSTEETYFSRNKAEKLEKIRRLTYRYFR